MTFKRTLFIFLMLVLPWQTRWFSDAGMVAGYPWEQGRLSIYASWLVLLAFILVSLWQKRPVWRRPKWFEAVVVIGVLVPAMFSSEPRASIAWLISAIFACLLVWVIKREEIAAQEVALWFAVSLVPQALLGMGQFAFQWGWANKWLGLPSLDPNIKGTAVIASQGIRYLRAYGGFPHPNIFGGYLAMSLLWVAFAWTSYSDRVKKFLLTIMPLLSMALAFSASRSAWLALALGLLLSSRATGALAKGVEGSRRLWLAVLVPFLLTLMAFPFLVRPVSVGGAVEEKSVNERLVALQQVPAAFRHAPFFGTGQGGLLPVLVQQKLEPLLPHTVPVMILLETGLWGVIWLLVAMVFWIKRMQDKRLLIALMPLLLLDHYLWSYWPGMALFVIWAVYSEVSNEMGF
ncbi:MAG: O-antigen ligase family protein [Patescibacteria group bacterium]